MKTLPNHKVASDTIVMYNLTTVSCFNLKLRQRQGLFFCNFCFRVCSDRVVSSSIIKTYVKFESVLLFCRCLLVSKIVDFHGFRVLLYEYILFRPYTAAVTCDELIIIQNAVFSSFVAIPHRAVSIASAPILKCCVRTADSFIAGEEGFIAKLC